MLNISFHFWTINPARFRYRSRTDQREQRWRSTGQLPSASLLMNWQVGLTTTEIKVEGISSFWGRNRLLLLILLIRIAAQGGIFFSDGAEYGHFPTFLRESGRHENEEKTYVKIEILNIQTNINSDDKMYFFLHQYQSWLCRELDLLLRFDAWSYSHNLCILLPIWFQNY